MRKPSFNAGRKFIANVIECTSSHAHYGVMKGRTNCIANYINNEKPLVVVRRKVDSIPMMMGY